MSFQPVKESPAASATAEKVERVRLAIEGELGPVGLAVANLVRSMERGSSRDRVAQRVEEVLGETVFQALRSAASFDGQRPVVPWLIGIARNVLRGEAREAAGQPALVSWDAVAWERVCEVIEAPERTTAIRMDIETMLARLSPAERLAIESRYWKGLGGRELAEALGAPSEEAARVRVFRAVQTLKRLYAAGPEVTP